MSTLNYDEGFRSTDPRHELDLDALHDAWIEGHPDTQQRRTRRKRRGRARNAANGLAELSCRARRREIDAYRRRRLASRLTERLRPDESIASPEQRLMETETLSHVGEEVRRLPPKERKVVVLWYWHDKRAATIASRLGMAVPTVYDVLRRARKLLEIRLRESRD